MGTGNAGATRPRPRKLPVIWDAEPRRKTTSGNDLRPVRDQRQLIAFHHAMSGGPRIIAFVRRVGAWRLVAPRHRTVVDTQVPFSPAAVLVTHQRGVEDKLGLRAQAADLRCRAGAVGRGMSTSSNAASAPNSTAASTAQTPSAHGRTSSSALPSVSTSISRNAGESSATTIDLLSTGHAAGRFPPRIELHQLRNCAGNAILSCFPQPLGSGADAATGHAARR